MKKYFWNYQEFSRFVEELRANEYQVIAPQVKDGAIVYDAIESTEQLPKGWTEEQKPGSYEIAKRDDNALFGYVVGPHSWKSFLHPSSEELWKAKKVGDSIEVEEVPVHEEKLAFLGVRSCDLKSIQILDKVFAENSNFQTRRKNNLIIAINCTESGTNCFCTSMDSGPEARQGYDLALTEWIGEGFVVQVGSEGGQEWLDKIGTTPATDYQVRTMNTAIESCAQGMEKSLNTEGIKELLYDNLDHGMWNDIAEVCLSCANCTMVCPTCFCSTVEDHTNLAGTETTQVRRWDSCFNPGHSYVHGGSQHASTSSKYRQWVTHKLASWQDQYGSLGCTGCGRCVTWCPVGIDFTKEIEKLRGNP